MMDILRNRFNGARYGILGLILGAARRCLSEWMEAKLELTEVTLASPCRTQALSRDLDWLPVEFTVRDLSPLHPETFTSEPALSSMVFETLANADDCQPQSFAGGRCFDLTLAEEDHWGKVVEPSRRAVSYQNPDQFPLESNRSGGLHDQVSLLDPECFI